VLEVGAGTGELWKHIDYSKARLTLVDFSPAMCEKMRELPKGDIHQCDATSLSFDDGSFDLVIVNHMLFHVDNPDLAFEGIRKGSAAWREGCCRPQWARAHERAQRHQQCNRKAIHRDQLLRHHC
jgi:SAM-dependent methyltransferase